MLGELLNGAIIALGALTVAALFGRAIARTEFPFRNDIYGDHPFLPEEARRNHVEHKRGINR